ncbi:MAG: hypothetical protein HY940_00810 [Gammaproteobacteria bacterium]|nr:hypothetical protein [Gammaproteobacteria bacterium]
MNQTADVARPRFLCDVMLADLCRYLRAAGYDTLLAEAGRPDRELLAQCHAQRRYLLTLDRLINDHKAANNVAVLLPRGDLDNYAALLSERFAIDWLKDAFSRCLLDNTPLIAADGSALARMPADARRADEPVYQCPHCGRVYWQGSHTKRMRTRLARWQAHPPDNN